MEILSQITLPAEFGSLLTFLESVTESAVKQGFSSQIIGRISVASEEALVNIIKYAFPEKPGDIRLACLKDPAGNFIIELEDGGIPFNVLEKEDPFLSSRISDRKIGGLGIHIIKKFTDGLQYRREGNKNILRMILKMDK